MKSGWVRSAGLFLAVAGTAIAAAQTGAPVREELMARLAAGAGSPPLFEVLTPLLLDYVESILIPAKAADLYAAETPADFLERLESLTGKDLIDLGADMFAFYESKPAAGDAKKWTSFPAGPFLVFIHPGSAADRDRDLIARQLAATTAAVVEALGAADRFEAARAFLQPPAEDAPGLIPVRLFASRREDGVSKIRKHSQGSATLGATIVDKAGRLTFTIDVLYLNALSLTVLEHEAAHAVVLLSTFDTASLTSGPLRDEAGLRKAFFAGYRKVPTFLQEGLGDWGFYYRGFHRAWGLLPPPGALVSGLEEKSRTLPLAELLAGDIRYAARNRKAYSLQAASFIEFLLATQGKEKVLRWLLTKETNAAKTFEGVFGLTITEAGNEWKTARSSIPSCPAAL
ncbi:MAG: hypothetical protein PHE62_12000 [Acidobacteriota bacterium]|nr:hypothetical protein [Acidobacteriota bacterium]